MNEWLIEHPWISYLIIFSGLLLIYDKVFRTRKLPVLKEILLWIIIGSASFILWAFQRLFEFPIIPSLLVALGLMALVKIRYWVEARQKKTE